MKNKNTTKSNTKSNTKSVSKSQQMIDLWLKKTPINVIYKQMNVRYNFVNNVIHRYCRKHGVQFDTYNPKEQSKKSVILRMYFDEGITSYKEIAKSVDSHETYVWNCIDEYRQSIL